MLQVVFEQFVLHLFLASVPGCPVLPLWLLGCLLFLSQSDPQSPSRDPVPMSFYDRACAQRPGPGSRSCDCCEGAQILGRLAAWPLRGGFCVYWCDSTEETPDVAHDAAVAQGFLAKVRGAQIHLLEAVLDMRPPGRRCYSNCELDQFDSLWHARTHTHKP